MTFDELQWQKFPVLDDGFVCLVDAMGNDHSVVQAARVSYGRDNRAGVWDADGLPVSGKGKDDRRLIRYLMRHRHSTPFEMAELKFLVRVPMDTWRQWIRHRTANVNEYSTRYSEAIDSQQTTPPDQWRAQSKSNKQGSGEGKLDWPHWQGDLEVYAKDRYDSPEEFLTSQEDILHDLSRKVYEGRLTAGVAREQARKDLPLSTYTEAYWKIDLHNLLHFLNLRMDSHAQHEIRQYAATIGEQIVKPLFPIVWEAFEDYRLQSMHLTRLDVEMIGCLNLTNSAAGTGLSFEEIFNKGDFAKNGWHKDKCRERDECRDKLRRLGIL